MSSYFLLFLFIFGLGHPKQDPIDPAKGAKLQSRLRCDGYGAPEDLIRIKASYSSSAWAREFVLSRYHDYKCELDVKGKCLHKIKEGWRDVWTASNQQPSAHALLPLSSCYQWGSSELAQYVLSG